MTPPTNARSEARTLESFADRPARSGAPSRLPLTSSSLAGRR